MIILLALLRSGAAGGVGASLIANATLVATAMNSEHDGPRTFFNRR